MNERIKLPAQEWLGYDPEKGDLHGYTFEQMREFAELIVKECIKLCEHESNDDEYDQYDMGMSVKAENIKTAIKEHFGVE